MADVVTGIFGALVNESNVVNIVDYFSTETYLAEAVGANGYVRGAGGILGEVVNFPASASGAGADLISGGGVGASSNALKIVGSEIVEGGGIRTVTQGIASKVPTVLVGAGIVAALGLGWSANLAYSNPDYIEELEELINNNRTTPIERAWLGFLKNNFYYVDADLVQDIADFHLQHGAYDAGFTPIENNLTFGNDLTLTHMSWVEFRTILAEFFTLKKSQNKISDSAIAEFFTYLDTAIVSTDFVNKMGDDWICIATCDNESFDVENDARFDFNIFFYKSKSNGKYEFELNPSYDIDHPYITNYNTYLFNGNSYWGYPHYEDYDSSWHAWVMNFYFRGGGVRSFNSRGDMPIFMGYEPNARESLRTNLGYVFSNIGYMGGGGIDGVNKQSGADYPEDDVPLSTTYPAWFNTKITVPVYDPVTGQQRNKIFLPIMLPTTALPAIQGLTEEQDDAQTLPISDPNSQTVIEDGALELPQQIIEDNPAIPVDDTSPTDTGDTPIPLIPFDVLGNGMIMVYNPTKAELQTISSFLWSSNFIDNIKKIFNDPMQAIISLHVLYAKPTISSNKTDVKIGFLDSGADSYYVTEQYVDIDCGSVTLNEYFGNYMDYDFTEVFIHLPFIGIVPLKTTDVMKSIISVSYKVDVISGCCLCNVSIERNEMDAILYTYSGNCSVPLPYSASNYANMITGLLGVVGATVGTIATGGASLAISSSIAIGSLGNAIHRDISHGGSISGNSGAMGVKKPYLIVNRHIPYNSARQNEFIGLPSNAYVTLGSCAGFTKVKDVHLTNINATDEELTMINDLLKEGVIL